MTTREITRMMLVTTSAIARPWMSMLMTTRDTKDDLNNNRCNSKAGDDNEKDNEDDISDNECDSKVANDIDRNNKESY